MDMSIADLQCMRVWGRLSSHGRYYRQHLFSWHKAYFFTGQPSVLAGGRETSGLGIRLVDKDSADLQEMVVKALAALKCPKRLSAAETVESIVRMNELMCIVLDGETVVAQQWFSPGMSYMPWLKACLRLSDDEIYEHGIFVKESHRRRGLLTLMRSFVYERIKERGFARVVNAVMSWNVATLRSNSRFGFQRMGAVVYGYIAGCRYCFAAMPEGRLSCMSGTVLNVPHSLKGVVYE